MKAKLFMLVCLAAITGCAEEKDACLDLRIGMKKADIERIVGRADLIHHAEDDLYRDVSVYYYSNKGPFAERDVLFVANREDELINIRCADKPIRLRADGTYVDEFYIHRWRIDKNPPANKKVTSPQ